MTLLVLHSFDTLTVVKMTLNSSVNYSTPSPKYFQISTGMRSRPTAFSDFILFKASLTSSLLIQLHALSRGRFLLDVMLLGPYECRSLTRWCGVTFSLVWHMMYGCSFVVNQISCPCEFLLVISCMSAASVCHVFALSLMVSRCVFVHVHHYVL